MGVRSTDENSNLGKKAYLVGYPGETTDRQERFGKPDAPGGVMRVTFGKFVDLYEGQAATTNKFEKNQYYDAIDNYLLHSFMDATYGISGGPIMNDRGEVVGIITERDVTLKGPEPALTLGLTKKRLLNLETLQLTK